MNKINDSSTLRFLFNNRQFIFYSSKEVESVLVSKGFESSEDSQRNINYVQEFLIENTNITHEEK